jgi:hypothetical protein
MHPFGGKKVHRTFFSARLTALKGRVSLASTFSVQLDFPHTTVA